MLTRVITRSELDKLVIESNYEFQVPIVNRDELDDLRVSNHLTMLRTGQVYGDEKVEMSAPQ